MTSTVPSSGAGRSFWGPGDLYTFLVTGAETGGTCFTLSALVAPGGGPPPHIHHREEEFFDLLEGQLHVAVGDHSRSAGPGDFAHIPRGAEHRFSNPGKGFARMLATFTPAGMEGWFTEALDPAPDLVTPPPPATPNMIAKMLALGPKYGVEWALPK